MSTAQLEGIFSKPAPKKEYIVRPTPGESYLEARTWLREDLAAYKRSMKMVEGFILDATDLKVKKAYKELVQNYVDAIEETKYALKEMAQWYLT